MPTWTLTKVTKEKLNYYMFVPSADIHTIMGESVEISILSVFLLLPDTFHLDNNANVMKINVYIKAGRKGIEKHQYNGCG